MSRPIILAADDSVTVRKLIEISLKADEFDLHFAVNGKECLAKANALKPALLLLDYILPDMKGVDICHALLNRPETRDIPARGEAWVDGPVLDVLELKVGDALLLGDARLRIGRVIVTEPDRGAGFVNFAPRVMINEADLPASKLSQPARRVT